MMHNKIVMKIASKIDENNFDFKNYNPEAYLKNITHVDRGNFPKN